jgi:pilus assembly protein CpaD
MADARLRRLRLGALGALLVLTTCQMEPEQQDYTKRFPIEAQPETVTLTASAGGVAGAQFDTLVAGYLDRGHGPLTVSGSAPPPQMQAVRARLIAAGVPASAIRIERAVGAGPNTVTLAYQRYNVVVPVCGDWSKPMQFNPANTDYPEFGCAMQRDLGLMLADPGDAVGMRAPQPTDAQNADRVIRAFRTGNAPAAKQSGIQDSADQNVAAGTTAGAATPVPTSTR